MPRGSTTTTCVGCGAAIGVATKKCKYCQSEQPRKQRLAKKLQKFDAKKETWLKNQKKNQTTTHVLDEASVLVREIQQFVFSQELSYWTAVAIIYAITVHNVSDIYNCLVEIHQSSFSDPNWYRYLSWEYRLIPIRYCQMNKAYTFGFHNINIYPC